MEAEKIIDDGGEPEPGARSLRALIEDGDLEFSIEIKRAARGGSLPRWPRRISIAEVQRIRASVEPAARLGVCFGRSASLPFQRFRLRLRTGSGEAWAQLEQAVFFCLSGELPESA